MHQDNKHNKHTNHTKHTKHTKPNKPNKPMNYPTPSCPNIVACPTWETRATPTRRCNVCSTVCPSHSFLCAEHLKSIWHPISSRKRR